MESQKLLSLNESQVQTQRSHISHDQQLIRSKSNNTLGPLNSER